MNIRKIIKEEVEDFDWIEDINITLSNDELLTILRKLLRRTSFYLVAPDYWSYDEEPWIIIMNRDNWWRKQTSDKDMITFTAKDGVFSVDDMVNELEELTNKYVKGRVGVSLAKAYVNLLDLIKTLPR